MDNNSLAHTKWECKYHLVFAPKYRRQIIYGKLKVEVGKILRDLCERKGIEIIQAECCVDHIHMLVKKVYYSFETDEEGYVVTFRSTPICNKTKKEKRIKPNLITNIGISVHK